MRTCRLIAVTGGPGAGKTALLEVVRRQVGPQLGILPESAGILFGGGFPRHATDAGRRAAQRAIYRVQRELERLTIEEGQLAVALCDRGTVDGVAYWPGSARSYWDDLGTTEEAELARYHAVLHLRTPPPGNGYDHSNPLRTESAHEAAEIDARIARAWSAHPIQVFVDPAPTFMDKVTRALTLLRDLAPDCWRSPSR
jgi:predicted ATPase